LLVLALDSVVNSKLSDLLLAILSSVALYAFYVLLNISSKGGMGLGDAKLALSTGLLTGYISGFTVVAATFIAFFLGALIGVIVLISKKGSRKTAIPFGPFIYLGTLLAPWLSPLLLQLL
jgi:leader peptidase (prepilin peptidase)/N-methyltransferase